MCIYFEELAGYIKFNYTYYRYISYIISNVFLKFLLILIGKLTKKKKIDQLTSPKPNFDISPTITHSSQPLFTSHQAPSSTAPRDRTFPPQFTGFCPAQVFYHYFITFLVPPSFHQFLS